MKPAKPMHKLGKTSELNKPDASTNLRNDLILATDISPDLSGSGSQHLRDIISCLNKYSQLKTIQINTESLGYHGSEPPADHVHALEASSNLQHITLQTLFENTVIGDVEQTAYLYRIRINAYKFFDKFNREMDSVKAHSTVVIFVQWPGMIFLWEAFASSKWRTVPILMDRFEPLFIAYPLAKSSQALIRDSFNAALLQSDGLLTGSIKAAKALSKTLQVPCREVLSVFRETSALKVADGDHGLAGFRPLRIPRNSSNRIALAGQIYARDTVELFISSLERLNDLSNCAGPKCSLDFYGDWPIENLFNNSFVTTHEPLEYSKLMITLASTCSFGLVPYSFDQAFSSSAEFSFPSKLVAYIQAGLIPIYVGPKRSSVFELLDIYGLAGLCITEIDVTLICQSLETIFLSDHDTIRSKLLALSHVFRPEYLQLCINSVFDQVS
jgi:hypothetical protein